MNIPIVNVNGFDGDGTAEAQQDRLNYILKLGTLSSALEHAVPEQMFVTPENPGEAISAVKALSKASAAGQRIYHITSANQASVLPNIHHNSLVMNEIRNALNTGKEVITHTDTVSVPGWSGAGYIIYDPVTGDGAYKIGGGANGGFFDLGLLNGAAAAVFLAGALTGAAAPLMLVLFIVLAASLIATAFVIAEAENPDQALDCFLLGFYSGFGVMFAALGKHVAAFKNFLVAMLATLSVGFTGSGTLGQCDRSPF